LTKANPRATLVLVGERFLPHPRLDVQFTHNPGKRPKRFYDVPLSVVKAEWEMMHSVNKGQTDAWEKRHPYQKLA
jgi:hypothetical protein